jgi:hypothetical protein
MKHDHPEFLAFVQEACKGNEEAAAMLVMLTDLAHFFDDLYDGDKGLTRGNVQTALWTSLAMLPRNAFYRQYFGEIQPLVSNAIVNWRVANHLERVPGDETDLRVAFIVRSSYADLIQQTAMICGGPEWAVEVGVAVRKRCHAESWQDYLKSVEVLHGNVQRTESSGHQPGDDRVGAGERADRPAASRHGQRAVRMVETAGSGGSPSPDADLPATTADR